MRVVAHQKRSREEKKGIWVKAVAEGGAQSSVHNNSAVPHSGILTAPTCIPKLKQPNNSELSAQFHAKMSRAAEAAMAASYKALKEDFVSNLTGGSIMEINFVTAVSPVSPSSPCE